MDTTTQPPTQVELNLQDLRGVKTCVEIACQRGAYRADEMKIIGTIYDKLASFLSAVDAAQAAAANETATATEEVSAPVSEAESTD